MLINLSLDPKSAYFLGTPPLTKTICVSLPMVDYISLKVSYLMKLGFLILIYFLNPNLLLSHLMVSHYHLSISYLYLIFLILLCLNLHSLMLLLLPLSNLQSTLLLPGLRPHLVPRLEHFLLSLVPLNLLPPALFSLNIL